MTNPLEKEVLLKGPLIWNPNLRKPRQIARVRACEQKFREVFGPYIGQLVLVQGIDNNCRLATRYPADAKLFILQHGILTNADRREEGRGQNFYLAFSESDTSAIEGYGWASHLSVLNFVGSEISRVIGSRGEIIYQDPKETRRWNHAYKRWLERGQFLSISGRGNIGSFKNYSPCQMFQRELQKAVSENLLKAYRIRNQ